MYYDEKKQLARLYGKKLKAQRKAMGLTQKRMSQKCDMESYTHYVYIEMGKKLPDLQELFKIYRICHFSIDELFDKAIEMDQ